MVSNKPLLVSGCFGAAGKVVSSSAGCLLVQCLLSPVVISLGTQNPRHPSQSLLSLQTKALSLFFWFMLLPGFEPPLYEIFQKISYTPNCGF